LHISAITAREEKVVVRFFNCFEVPAGREDEFFAAWQRVNEYMAAKPGYVSHQLHRSQSPEARFRFLNFVVWESPQHWTDAHDAGFRELVSGPEWSDFRSTHALFDVIHSGGDLQPAAS
jgi:heme-degrading monooxygenase HmoA